MRYENNCQSTQTEVSRKELLETEILFYAAKTVRNIGMKIGNNACPPIIQWAKWIKVVLVLC